MRLGETQRALNINAADLRVVHAIEYTIRYAALKQCESHMSHYKLAFYITLHYIREYTSTSANRKSTHAFVFAIPLNKNSCSTCHRFTEIPKTTLGRPKIYGAENYINRNIGHTFLFDFCVHRRVILHRFCAMHASAGADGLTDRHVLAAIGRRL